MEGCALQDLTCGDAEERQKGKSWNGKRLPDRIYNDGGAEDQRSQRLGRTFCSLGKLAGTGRIWCGSGEERMACGKLF